MTDSALWQTVLSELEGTTSKAHFETWLRNTKLLSLDGTVAVITVPNVFIREWVESRYKQQLIASFRMLS